jgi:hypothetical protein
MPAAPAVVGDGKPVTVKVFAAAALTTTPKISVRSLPIR